MDVPWLIYYAPTTKSGIDVYPEFKQKFAAIKQAYIDATKINHIGNLDKHVEALNYRAKKMNEILKKGYTTFRYVSVDSKTKMPDGKTNFEIEMSPKSKFNAARTEMKKYGHRPLVNIPTEEVFTAPQANTAQGILSTTLPLSLNGKLVEGIRFKFDKGKVVEVSAEKNEDVIKSHIKNYENADRLGELAIVANSPIEATKRIFKSTLLDENAACHFALGDAYPETIEGAEKFENYKELMKYLKDLNINSSDTHVDFMVGSDNLDIFAINKDTKDTIKIIENNKFLL